MSNENQTVKQSKALLPELVDVTKGVAVDVVLSVVSSFISEITFLLAYKFTNWRYSINHIFIYSLCIKILQRFI